MVGHKAAHRPPQTCRLLLPNAPRYAMPPALSPSQSVQEPPMTAREALPVRSVSRLPESSTSEVVTSTCSTHDARMIRLGTALSWGSAAAGCHPGGGTGRYRRHSKGRHGARGSTN